MNLDKAILIATTVHQGQVDKAGAPYILHPLHVMLSLPIYQIIWTYPVFQIHQKKIIKELKNTVD